MGAAFTALLKGLHTMGNSFMERGEESFKEWGALAGYPGVGTGTSEGFDIYGRYYQNDYFSGNFFLGDIMAGGANDLFGPLFKKHRQITTATTASPAVTPIPAITGSKVYTPILAPPRFLTLYRALR